MPSLKSSLITALKLAFSFGLIAWMIMTDKLPLAELKSLFEPGVLFFGLASVAMALLIAAERWRALLLSQGFQVERAATYRMTLVGTFFSYFLPGGVGGDVVKAYYVVKNLGERRAQAVGTVVFDRLIGLFTMILFALITSLVEYEILLQHPALKSFILLLAGLFVAFLAVFWLMWSRRTSQLRDAWLKRLERINFVHQALFRLNQFQLRKMAFVRIVALSLLSQSFSLLFFITIAPFMGESAIPLSVFLFCVPLGFMATAIPISPGGIGVGQAAFLFLFNLVLARETQIGPLLITAYQLFTLAFGLIGAGLYVMQKTSPPPASLFREESSSL